MRNKHLEGKQTKLCIALMASSSSRQTNEQKKRKIQNKTGGLKQHR